MAIDVVPKQEEPDALQLCTIFRQLDDERRDLDRRIASLGTDGSEESEASRLWQQLESLLARQRKVIDNLARAPVAETAHLRAMAEVLSSLVRSNNTEDSREAWQSEINALALALAESIVQRDW